MLLVNSATVNCGVYQYGKRLWNSINKYSVIYKYIEVSTPEEFFNIDCKPKVILFNYISSGRANRPLGWLTNEILLLLKQSGHVVGVIGHLTDVGLDFDFIVSQDPNCQESERVFALPRPLFEKRANDFISPFHDHCHGASKSVKVGSFGFAAATKQFPKLVEMVSSQFNEATIRLNITNANYHDANGSIRDDVISQCLAIKRPPKVNLTITNTMLSDEEIIKFLRGNDLNIFAYNDVTNNDGGISSAIDYAVSAGRPIAINSSFMFRHIYSDNICIDKRSLPSIISFGSNWMDGYRQNWSSLLMNEKFEEILSTVNIIR